MARKLSKKWLVKIVQVQTEDQVIAVKIHHRTRKPEIVVMILQAKIHQRKRLKIQVAVKTQVTVVKNHLQIVVKTLVTQAVAKAQAVARAHQVTVTVVHQIKKIVVKIHHQTVVHQEVPQRLRERIGLGLKIRL